MSFLRKGLLLWLTACSTETMGRSTPDGAGGSGGQGGSGGAGGGGGEGDAYVECHTLHTPTECEAGTPFGSSGSTCLWMEAWYADSPETCAFSGTVGRCIFDAPGDIGGLCGGTCAAVQVNDKIFYKVEPDGGVLVQKFGGCPGGLHLLDDGWGECSDRTTAPAICSCICQGEVVLP